MIGLQKLSLSVSNHAINDSLAQYYFCNFMWLFMCPFCWLKHKAQMTFNYYK